ncbi:MAG: Bifunctional protein HldE [Chlamydiae bacterium]|nr:Bifunctional protein HldE [Chlamydiota bacterium]
MFDSWSKECRKKIILPSDLKATSEKIKRHQKLVTLNGSFDLLHAGHLYMLQEAKKQGDCLLVALNSDESIKQYKSKDRPIISLHHRLEMMAALQCVDYVTWFEETDPLKILSLIKPHVHVNGSEYGKTCLEADLINQQGGTLHIVDLKDGLSTSNIVEKIRTICV